MNVFSDGIIGIGIDKGMIRIDVGHISTKIQDEEGDTPLELSQRIVMTPEAFGSTYSMLSEFMEKLVETGIISVEKRGHKNNEIIEVEGETDSTSGEPISPNFAN